MKIDGEFLSHLRFADDIFLCTETPQELQQMLQELSDESRRMGLKMNITKTKVMVVDNTPINVNNVLIENVQGYVYLGQQYSLKENNQDKEIQRRIMAGWAAYAKHRDIFKSNLAICLKRQVYNSCVLPAMTYGADTWTLTRQAQNKLAAAQTKMERSMLNITLLPCYLVPSSRGRLLVIPMTVSLQASRSLVSAHSSVSVQFVMALMSSSHRARGLPLFLAPPPIPNIIDFSKLFSLRMMCPKYDSCCFFISASSGLVGLISSITD